MEWTHGRRPGVPVVCLDHGCVSRVLVPISEERSDLVATLSGCPEIHHLVRTGALPKQWWVD